MGALNFNYTEKMVKGGKTDGRGRPRGRGTGAGPAAAREPETSARAGRRPASFPSAPAPAPARQPIPTLLQQKGRKKLEAKRKEVLLVMWHVPARCPGSEDSAPPEPRPWGLGPVQTPRRRGARSRGRIASRRPASWGPCRKRPRQHKRH